MSPNRADVTLYTLSGCLHCGRARRRLRRHGVNFREVCGDGDPAFRRRLLELTGHGTVPQVIIDGEAVGGADDLARLDRRGVLTPRLEGRAFPHPVITRRLPPWRWAVELRGGDGGTVRRSLPAASRRDAARAAAELMDPAVGEEPRA